MLSTGFEKFLLTYSKEFFNFYRIKFAGNINKLSLFKLIYAHIVNFYSVRQ